MIKVLRGIIVSVVEMGIITGVRGMGGSVGMVVVGGIGMRGSGDRCRRNSRR